MSGPLEGVRVIDMTSVVMGPYASRLLGDYGADVVKIEPPEGDIMRLSGPMRSPGMGHLYLTTNRNKRSAVVDLKQPAGREVLLRLLAHADVLLYNVRPQAMQRLRLSYEDVRAVNAGIIYAGAFGFSQRGPYAERPAYDDLIQGMSGVPWLVQKAGADTPRYAPMIFADRTVGLQLAFAVASALHHRQRTGHGQRVDVPMYEGMLDVVLGEHLAGRGFVPDEGPTGYARSLTVNRRPYRTSDGYICILVYSDKQWRSFFQAIGEPRRFEEDRRFSTHGERVRHIDEVYGYLSEVLARRPTSEWLTLLEAADVPAAPMYSLEDVMSDEHLGAIGYLTEVDHPTEGRLRQISIPTEWSDSQPTITRHAPTLGEHTFEVLTEVGYSREELGRLMQQGVVIGKGPPASR